MHTPHRTRRAVGALGLTLSGISAPLLAGTAVAADPPRHAVCDQFACLLNVSGLDSDGDGVTDDDERAYGSDPHDPNSHPPVRLLLGSALLKQLPSFLEGRTVVVGLPAADREASVAGVLGTPGGGKMDVAMTGLGKRLTLEGASALTGGSVQGFVKSLFDAKPPVTIPGKGGGIDPTIAAGYGAGDVQQLGMTITVHRDGSSTSQNKSFEYSGAFTGELYTVVTERDSRGHTTQITATVQIINDNLDGAEYETITEFDSEGNVVSQSTTCTANCPPPVPPDNGGEGGDPGDKPDDGEEEEEEPGDYPSDSEGETAIVYTNADETTWVLTPADVERAVGKLGWNTNATTPVQISADPSDLPPPGPDPLVALVADDGVVVIGAAGPIDYDRAGGNITPGPVVPLPVDVPFGGPGGCVPLWGRC